MAVIATILIVGTRPPPRALPVYFPSVRLPGRRKEDEMPMAPGMLTRRGAPEGKSCLGLKVCFMFHLDFILLSFNLLVY